MKKNADARIAASVFAALALIFWRLRCHTFGPGDSGQHVVAALTWGVSRPPGYPLYDFLGWLWTRLPWGEPTAAVDGLSGLCAAAAAALFYLGMRRQSCGRPAALTAAGLMAFSPLFWYYSEVAEVRALNDLLAVASAYLLFGWLKSGGRRRFTLFAGVFGLGLSHHPTFALLAPAFAWALWPARRRATRDWAPALGAVACGVALPYAILWLRLKLGSPPVYNPDGIATAREVLGLFLRRNTGGYFNMFAHARSPLRGFNVFAFLEHADWMLSGLASGLGTVGIAAAGGGIAVLWRKDRATLLFWELWFGVTALVFLVLSSQQMPPLDPDYLRAVSLRFYLLPMIGLFALAGFFLDWLLARARVWLGWTLVACVWLAPLCFRRVDLRGHDWTKLYGEAIIDSSGPRDFVILASDESIVATTYLDLIERRAGDRVFLMPWLFSYSAYLDGLRRRHPELTIPRAKNGAISGDLRDWLKVNPGRAIRAEAVDLPHLASDFGHAGLHGALAVALTKPQTVIERGRQAEIFLHSPLARLDPRQGYLDTQEIYLVKTLGLLWQGYGLRARP